MRLESLNRWLAACLAGMCCLRWQLPTRGEANTASGRPTGVEPICSYDRFSAVFISRLGIQYLNDGTPIPTAFENQSATYDPNDSARFRVYARSDDPRFYCDVTAGYKSVFDGALRGCRLRLSFHPFEPQSGRRDVVHLVDTDAGPYLEYFPRLGPRARDEKLAFTLRVPSFGIEGRSFRSAFVLHLPPAPPDVPPPGDG